MLDRNKQFPSWCNPKGHKDYPGLVGQIFFPFDESALDDEDKLVLGKLVDALQIALLGKRVELTFVGNTDYIGAREYNQTLGGKRAKSVMEYVNSRLGSMANYSGSSRSLGEKFASSKSLAGDRRVDVYSSYLVPKAPVVLPEITIKGTYSGPLSRKFKFRTFLGAGVGIGPIAGQVLSVEVMNSRTKRSAMYTYSGAGPGIGFSYSRPSGWEEKDLKEWIDVDDLEGNGKIFALGAGKTGTAFVFYGPKERGKTEDSIMATFESWDLVVGVEADAFGYWHRR